VWILDFEKTLVSYRTHDDHSIKPIIRPFVAFFFNEIRLVNENRINNGFGYHMCHDLWIYTRSAPDRLFKQLNHTDLDFIRSQIPPCLIPCNTGVRLYLLSCVQLGLYLKRTALIGLPRMCLMSLSHM